MKNLRYDEGDRNSHERGIALILVMLAVLVLSMLAAGMVFSSRSETFASYNYKVDTQADYLAKAGIQRAVNFFRSQDYQPVSPSQATTYYQVNSSPSEVLCISGCSNSNQQVQFVSIPGTGNSNYPSITNGGGTLVNTAFTNDLSDRRVTGDANDSGVFYVNAVLMNYQTIKNTTNCPSSSGWTLGSACPVETWLITSQGIWTGGSGTSGTVGKATETAIIQTVFSGSSTSGSSLDNAIYALCSVTMSGSSGTCTDAYDSSKGLYGSGSNPAGSCDGSSPNIIDNDSSVGSNGGVTFSGNVNAGGNVIIGTGAPAGCPTGYTGNSKNVKGKVVTGPQITAPPLPPFPPPNDSLFESNPGAAPSYSATATLGTGGILPCVTGYTCNGTASNPYLVDNISLSGSNTLTLVGGSSTSPVVYYINSISESGQAQINITGPSGGAGYVILDVLGSISISGQGLVSNSNNTPEQVLVNDNCSNCSITLSGNGAIAAVVNAPGANVSLSGGGSSGYMLGAIMANNVTMSGGRPLHYDSELSTFPIGSSTTGKLSVPLITAYSRKKF